MESTQEVIGEEKIFVQGHVVERVIKILSCPNAEPGLTGTCILTNKKCYFLILSGGSPNASFEHPLKACIVPKQS